MAVTLESNDGHSLIRLDGAVNVTLAAELKRLLIEGLTAANDLRLDLQQVDAIDVTVLQLLWAAGSEAARRGATLAIRMSGAVTLAAREAGIEQFPGLAMEE